MRCRTSKETLRMSSRLNKLTESRNITNPQRLRDVSLLKLWAVWKCSTFLGTTHLLVFFSVSWFNLLQIFIFSFSCRRRTANIGSRHITHPLPTLCLTLRNASSTPKCRTKLSLNFTHYNSQKIPNLLLSDIEQLQKIDFLPAEEFYEENQIHIFIFNKKCLTFNQWCLNCLCFCLICNVEISNWHLQITS